MQIHFSLDYELFLQDPGSDIESSLIKPTKRLNQILEEKGIRAIYFVDAGYLSALTRQIYQHAILKHDYDMLVGQLVEINAYGHEIGLHVHPHWEDTYFDGKKWLVDLSRYKLADFDPGQASEIFKQYNAVLQEHTTKKIVSYRAGGWCLEPFASICSAMRECGIFIDSTVYHGGRKETATHSFDFTSYPQKDIWRFETHPSIEDANGYFTEIPCSTCKLHPTVYWKLMLYAGVKKIKKTKSGYGVKPSFNEILFKLMFTTLEAVSIDSFKSTALMKAFKSAECKGQNHFCIIGHPKCFTDDTYRHVNKFINYALAKGHSFSTFCEIISKYNNI